MAVYKVPQDVEAEDKLIGPFSFRQFIYLIIAAMTIGLEWALAQVFIGLILIPMPLTILFLAIALPLRKDQPMELWLAAVVRFFIKPRLKMWWPEGEINLVTIIAPHEVETKVTKDLTPEEARQRFIELAEVIDTQGWSRRGIQDYTTLSAYGHLQDTAIAESSTVQDIMDESQGVGLQFNSLIEEQEELHRQKAEQQFREAAHSAATQPAQTAAQPTSEPPMQPSRQIQAVRASATTPYTPSQPALRDHTAPAQSTQAPQPQEETTPPSTSKMPVRADILDLANNNQMSISSIAREIHRLEDQGDEVVVEIQH